MTTVVPYDLVKNSSNFANVDLKWENLLTVAVTLVNLRVWALFGRNVRFSWLPKVAQSSHTVRQSWWQQQREDPSLHGKGATKLLLQQHKPLSSCWGVNADILGPPPAGQTGLGCQAPSPTHFIDRPNRDTLKLRIETRTSAKQKNYRSGDPSSKTKHLPWPRTTAF